MKEGRRLTLVFFLVFSLIFFGEASLVRAKNTSENIKNSVSATANTGGNKIDGGGKIETGDASAEAKAKIYTNGENSEMNASAKAEANGKTAEISTDEPGNLEAVADQNGTCVAKGDETCGADSVDITGNDSQANDRDRDVNKENIVERVSGAISDLSENILEKIKNWFT